MYGLLSRTQAEPGRIVKQGQERKNKFIKTTYKPLSPTQYIFLILIVNARRRENASQEQPGAQAQAAHQEARRAGLGEAAEGGGQEQKKENLIQGRIRPTFLMHFFDMRYCSIALNGLKTGLNSL